MLQWKLRRLAARVLRVLARQADLDPALGTFTLTLAPAAEAFIETYDALRTLSTSVDRELAQGKHQVGILGTKLIAYSAQVEATGAIEGFRRADYDGAAKVPDDVISDSEAFLAVIEQHVENHPEWLPMGRTIVEDMTVAIEVAQKEWGEAEGMKAEYRLALEHNRDNAKAFASLLVAFRKTLARTIGRSHPDYQTLRASRVDRTAPEEGEQDGLQPSPAPTPGPETADENLAEVG